ncbi:MAG: hypothetical protein DCE90_20015 [Pseudanabaena sp.]|nr:MAG: hypothetical protein DCE90_20015 [Pseudanabaena sp.]
MRRNIFYLLGAIACFLANVPTAFASGLWNYTYDSNNDSIAGNGFGGLRIGGTGYEVYGTGYKIDNNSFIFGVSTNLPREGRYTGPSLGNFSIENNSIALGDLLLNFKGVSLDGANGELLGIRFVPTNDAGVGGTGLFARVTAISKAGENAGWRLAPWRDTVQSRGGNPTHGALSANDSYFGGNPYVPTVIGGGVKLADITLLDAFGLLQEGFNTGMFGGSQIFGFKLDRSFLPEGSFIASLFYECFNDGTAFFGNVPPVSSIGFPISNMPIVSDPLPARPVPVPAAFLGIAAAGLFGGKKLLQRKQQVKA